MKFSTILSALGIALFMTFAPTGVLVGEDGQGDWKVGRVYYRFVCTVCHKEIADKVISPNEFTKAEWRAYLDADKHDKSARSEPMISYYTDQAYRETIKATNKAAEKFLHVPDDDMAANIRAWTIYGAKDSDTAFSCQ